MGQKLILLGLMWAVTACGPFYINEDTDERDMEASKGNISLRDDQEDDRAVSRKNKCDLSEETGCLVGQIVVAPSVYVEGIEYFDVNTLGQTFPQLIQVKDQEGNLLPASEYTVSVDPGLSNDKFLRDFALYMKGDRVEQIKIGTDGRFKLNYLEEGTYDIRVQKRFTITVTPKNPTETLGQKTFCMTLYSEAIGLEINANEMAMKGFDDYKMQLMDLQCEEKMPGSVLTL